MVGINPHNSLYYNSIEHYIKKYKSWLEYKKLLDYILYINLLYCEKKINNIFFVYLFF